MVAVADGYVREISFISGLKDFENAELLCSCLPSELKEQMNEEIRKVKEEGN